MTVEEIVRQDFAIAPYHDTGLLAEVAVPPIAPIRQRFARPRLKDIEGAVQRAYAEAGLHDRITRGSRIAVGVGSRGIAELAAFVGALITELKAAGAEPFIIPAMGSHGGATAAGQQAVLADLGISEQSMGVPVLGSTEVIQIGALPDGTPVYMTKLAYESDGVVLFNRIKPHTDFHGPIESGPSKMAGIGLGNARGAAMIHARGTSGLRDVMPRVARVVVERGNVLGALCVIENAYDEPAELVGMRPGEIGSERESQLLERARSWMPSLPVETLDVLVIQEMGKNISGSGMDPNVIGRMRIPGISDAAGPDITCIAVLRITPESHGNAAGLGLANVTTQKLASEINLEAFYLNCLTASTGGAERSMLPMTMPTDRTAVAAALRMCGRAGTGAARVAWIRSTLKVDDLWLSEAAIGSLRPDVDYERIGDFRPWPFRADGVLEWETPT